MNEAVKKEQIRSYAEDIVAPEAIEDIQYYTSFSDEAGESDVWLLESDTGNEYWVFEGAYPANMMRKSGIYQDAQRAYEAYVEMIQEEEEAPEVKDRFHIW